MEKKKRFLDAYTKVETRTTDGGKMFIDGMIPYNSLSEEMWGFVETIAPGAFKRTLNGGSDIFAFWAHDDTQVLASRRAGTLSLEDKIDGLHFSVELRDNAVSQDYFDAISRGDVVGVSFGFIAENETWDNTNEPAIRTLNQVRLLEISPGVAFPAYPGAQSDASRRTLYDEGAPEFRNKFKAEKPVDTSTQENDTPDPPDTAPEARLSLELDLIEAEYGIKSTKGD